MSSDLVIEQGNESDMSSCLEMIEQNPDHFTRESLDSVMRDLLAGTFFIAVQAEKIVGFVSTDKISRTTAEITWIAVAKGSQSKGIGTALVRHVADRYRKQGLKKIEVKTLRSGMVNDPYERTRKFYIKAGFVHTRDIAPYPRWSSGNPCSLYTLNL